MELKLFLGDSPSFLASCKKGIVESIKNDERNAISFISLDRTDLIAGNPIFQQILEIQDAVGSFLPIVGEFIHLLPHQQIMVVLNKYASNIRSEYNLEWGEAYQNLFNSRNAEAVKFLGDNAPNLTNNNTYQIPTLKIEMEDILNPDKDNTFEREVCGKLNSNTLLTRKLHLNIFKRIDTYYIDYCKCLGVSIQCKRLHCHSTDTTLVLSIPPKFEWEFIVNIATTMTQVVEEAIERVLVEHVNYYNKQIEGLGVVYSNPFTLKTNKGKIIELDLTKSIKLFSEVQAHLRSYRKEYLLEAFEIIQLTQN